MADARGHYTIGKELVDNVLDRVRRVSGMPFYMDSVQLNSTNSTRQLLLSAGFPNLPLFRRWYWFWIWCAAVGASRY